VESNLNNRLESIFSHKSNRIESKLFLANRNALTDIAHNIEIQCARYSVPGSSYINRNRPGRAGPGRCLASTYSLLPTTDRRVTLLSASSSIDVTIVDQASSKNTAPIGRVTTHSTTSRRRPPARVYTAAISTAFPSARRKISSVLIAVVINP